MWRKSVPYQFKSISEKPYPITLHKILDGTVKTKLTKITALILSAYAIFVMAKIMYDYNENQPGAFEHGEFLTAIGGLGVGLSILMYVEQKESFLFRKDEEREEKEDKNK
ncbi:hypothetical protein IC801_07035 [Geobacillus sp. 44B]|nr:hypothetical protein BSK33_15030 [Geobacillus sp. 44B]QNU38958.1 hypothetical protein IC801_07035 [Geobacillus sp. 44B]